LGFCLNCAVHDHSTLDPHHCCAPWDTLVFGAWVRGAADGPVGRKRVVGLGFGSMPGMEEVGPSSRIPAQSETFARSAPWGVDGMDRQGGSGPGAPDGTLPWLGHQSIDAPPIPRLERLAQEAFLKGWPGFLVTDSWFFFGVMESELVTLGEIRGADTSRNRG
jgi:hypothetical protein